MQPAPRTSCGADPGPALLRLKRTLVPIRIPPGAIYIFKGRSLPRPRFSHGGDREDDADLQTLASREGVHWAPVHSPTQPREPRSCGGGGPPVWPLGRPSLSSPAALPAGAPASPLTWTPACPHSHGRSRYRHVLVLQAALISPLCPNNSPGPRLAAP